MSEWNWHRLLFENMTSASVCLRDKSSNWWLCSHISKFKEWRISLTINSFQPKWPIIGKWVHAIIPINHTYMHASILNGSVMLILKSNKFANWFFSLFHYLWHIFGLSLVFSFSSLSIMICCWTNCAKYNSPAKCAEETECHQFKNVCYTAISGF